MITLKSVTLPNGETLGYRERESGEKIVLLVHGNMTSSMHWDLLMEAFDHQYKIYAVDMRGFGISTYLKPVESIKDFADDIKSFVDELGLKDFAMVGWSTGGAVSMEFCADYPGYCNQLVLLASASTRGYPFFGTNEDGALDVTKRLSTLEDIKKDPIRTIPIQGAYDSGNKELLKAIWNSLIYTKNQPSAEQYDEYLDDMLTQRNLAEVYHSLNTFNISNESGVRAGSSKVEKICIPVLILRGDEDLVVTDTMTKEIIQDLGPVAKYIELTGCGHSPLIDNLDLLKTSITNFLQETENKQYEIKG
ncbi:alpha/beta fold hydrolase [Peribacillus alkalitolerans]|uniref:intracellular short-chain-length polyhydroxyalkanoate depolymerase n=1 Tax=Peribacillus alkalitolerans TaxID=1550385 RepID=UPI0013D63CF5|nr:alpha/beta hydrolase [Peribacillus alkalitolerans]